MVELITADYPDVRIVGSVHSNTTLTCDRNFNNYPEWYGANGIQITYLNGMEINPSYSRLMWASNKRDLIIRDTQKSDAGNYTCSVPDSVIYIIAFEVRGIQHFREVFMCYIASDSYIETQKDKPPSV